ncbi:MAG: aldo/keto reductase [Defluviitaleaceae bacterium]|nr:aldo/keto reductase [Defluviitaleaceae bacterium]
MEYRELGKTGKKLSTISLGCEYLDKTPYEQVKETIDAALDAGINIFDIFMPGTEIRENIAKALGTKRNQIMIQGHCGATDINKQYDISRDMPTVKRYFEELLKLYGYIDFGMLFFIDSEQDYKDVFETEFVSYLEHLKKQGDVHHIGFSSHNPITALKVIETGVPEMMMFSINPAFDMLPYEEYVFDHSEKGYGSDLFRGIDPKRAELYKLCEQKQVGITVMKALGGGKLLSPVHTPYTKPLTVAQCIHYALSRPAVASVLIGCKTATEMQDALRYFDLSNEEKDYTEIISSTQNDFRGCCVYCSHCQPCPVEIDIATVTKYLDIAKLDKENIPPSIISHYNSLEKGGDLCIACGNCESRCPFDVRIIKNMKEAATLFPK